MPEPLLTAEELADRLKIRPGTVRCWHREGRIPAVHLSPKVVRFEEVAVIEALKRASAEKAVQHD
jgi:excisionase family DNA binding protein